MSAASIRLVCAAWAACLMSGFAGSASAQGLGATLAPPAGSPSAELQLELDNTPEPPPGFGALYGSAWAGWSAGVGIGAAVGLVGGLVAALTCASDPYGGLGCPLLMVGTGVSASLGVGGLIGAGVGVWRAGDLHGGGGEGWLALLGSILLPAVAVGLVGLIGLGVDEGSGLGTAMSVATTVSVIALPQLGATLFYELSRSF